MTSPLFSDPGDARRATGESGHGRCAVRTDPATPLAAPVTQPTGSTHLTVDPHEVEVGDLLIDAPYARVATIVTDGIVWTFRDHYGTVIAWWPAGVDVDVVRVEAQDRHRLEWFIDDHGCLYHDPVRGLR